MSERSRVRNVIDEPECVHFVGGLIKGFSVMPLADSSSQKATNVQIYIWIHFSWYNEATCSRKRTRDPRKSPRCSFFSCGQYPVGNTSLADLRTSQLLFIETFKEILFHLSSKCLERTTTGLTCVQEPIIVEVLSNFAEMIELVRSTYGCLLLSSKFSTCHNQTELVLPIAPGVIIKHFVIAAPLCSSDAITRFRLGVASCGDGR